MRTKRTVACALAAFIVITGGTAEATGLIHTSAIAKGAITFNRLSPNVQKMVAAKAVPGPAGATGQPGVNGAPGGTGSAGGQGPQGGKGDPGVDGDAGAPGATGPRGATGASGLKGDAGPKGDTGAKGDAGAVGPQGSPGAVGPRGPAGEPGATGASIVLRARASAFSVPPGAGTDGATPPFTAPLASAQWTQKADEVDRSIIGQVTWTTPATCHAPAGMIGGPTMWLYLSLGGADAGVLQLRDISPPLVWQSGSVMPNYQLATTYTANIEERFFLFEPGADTTRVIGVNVKSYCGSPGETFDVSRLALDVEGIR